jgi:hypothetical protein
MSGFFRGRLAALILGAACGAVLVQSSLGAESPAPPASVRSLDLSASDAQPLVEGLAGDLGSLLASAQYRRDTDDSAAPKHSLTSVRHLGEALRAHRGVAYVALAERVGGGDSVRLRAR